MIRFLALAFVMCFSVNAYSQLTPFECDGRFHQVFGPEGNSLTYDLETDTSVVAPNNSGFDMNAFGYRLADNFGYGSVTNTNQLVRIGATGKAINIGAVTGLPIPPGSYPAGAFAENGYLYLYRGGGALTNRIFVVDVDSLTVIDEIMVQGDDLNASDFTYNPTDDSLYGVTGEDGGLPPGNLFAVNIQTGIVDLKGPTGIGMTSFASMFSDRSGLVYGQDRSSGILYEFDTTTGAATAIGETFVNSITVPPGSGNVDGFYCVESPGPSVTVPTLSQWGLIAMAAVLGTIGFMVVRRRALA